MIEFSKDYVRSLLSKKGVAVSVPKTLFNITGKKRYTLKEAMDYALRGRLTNKLAIPQSEYVTLVTMLLSYKNNEPKSCSKLNKKYFDKTDKTRFALSEFCERLAEKGHYYMSSKKMQSTYGKPVETSKWI